MNKVMAGIDLHSNKAMVGLVDQEGRGLAHQKLECDLKKIVEFLNPFKERLESVAVESTYNWIGVLVSWLQSCIEGGQSRRCNELRKVFSNRVS